MSASDKLSAGMDKAKGKAKEALGNVTGDIKNAAAKAKDAAKDVFDR
jgi:uncharacterized protein YjbJ (UPF0337 family)